MLITIGNHISKARIGTRLNQINYVTPMFASIVSANAGKYEAWPQIAIDTSGNMYVVYRTASTNTHLFEATGRIVMRISQDSGLTWGGEITVVDTVNEDDRDPNILIFNDNGIQSILVTYVRWDGTNRKLCCVKSSAGETVIFGEEIVINSISGTARGNPIILTTNRILQAYYIASSRYIAYSDDGGLTWTNSVMNTMADINETSIIEVKTNGIYNGKVIAIHRFETSPYNFHISISEDYGLTWTNPVLNDTLLAERANPASIIRFGSNLLLFSGDGNGGHIYISNDEGNTWIYFKQWLFPSYPTRLYPSAVKINSENIGVVYCTNSTGSDVCFVQIKLTSNDYKLPGISDARVFFPLTDDSNELAFDVKQGLYAFKYGAIEGYTDPVQGMCYKFNGLDTYLVHQYLLDSFPSEITFSLWINAISISSNMVLICKTNILLQDRFYIIITSTGDIKFDSEVNDEGYISDTIYNGLQVGNWYNIVIVWSVKIGLKAYINNVNTYNSLIRLNKIRNGSSSNLTIGSSESYSLKFNGYIKNVCIWDRQLTEHEVDTNYNNGVALNLL